MSLDDDPTDPVLGILLGCAIGLLMWLLAAMWAGYL